MGRLVVTEFVSLDGVMGEPQEWSFPYWGDDMAKFKHDLLGIGALLALIAGGLIVIGL